MSIRVTKEGKATLMKMAEAAEKSLSQIISELLLTTAAKFNETYAKRFNEGYEKGRDKWRIWYFCSICNEMIFITPNSNAHKAMIEYMKENGWGHEECHEKNKQG